MEAVGHNGEFGDGPLKSECVEKTRRAEHGEAVQAPVPELFIVGERLKRFKKHPYLAVRVSHFGKHRGVQKPLTSRPSFVTLPVSNPRKEESDFASVSTHLPRSPNLGCNVRGKTVANDINETTLF